MSENTKDQVLLELSEARKIWSNRNTTQGQMGRLLESLARIYIHAPDELTDSVLAHMRECELRTPYMKLDANDEFGWIGGVNR